MSLLLRSPVIRARHGFAGRRGGVSEGAFAALNMRQGTGDDPAAVEENRRRFAAAFDADTSQLRLLTQVHGDRVVRAGSKDSIPEADAQHSDDPAHLLVVSTADCLPLLFHDPDTGAAAVAHCGWKGSLLELAARVVQEMAAQYGSNPARLGVAIGPGICRDCYQVGPEFAGHFARSRPGILRPDPNGPERFLLDLASHNVAVLRAAGVERIWQSSLCTSCDAGGWYSHRRDRGNTGRQWAAVAAGRADAT